MTDLRTRIAAVLADHDPEGAALCEYHYDVADAVIRELGLDRQAHYDPDCPYYRYVTEWFTDG